MADETKDPMRAEIERVFASVLPGKSETRGAYADRLRHALRAALSAVSAPAPEGTRPPERADLADLAAAEDALRVMPSASWTEEERWAWSDKARRGAAAVRAAIARLSGSATGALAREVEPRCARPGCGLPEDHVMHMDGLQGADAAHEFVLPPEASAPEVSAGAPSSDRDKR